MSDRLKVCIIGSGKWGSAVAKLVGENVLQSTMFHHNVSMFVKDCTHEGRLLTDIINTEHVNVKYLPNVKLPENIIAVPDAKETVKDADIIIFILRQQFLGVVCDDLKGHIKENAIGISLTKSLYHGDAHNSTPSDLKCASDIINEKLNMKVSVLMGPNLAEEIAREKFSETTIGCEDENLWNIWKSLFHCKYFKVKLSKEVKSIELCGALKNVVAAAAGLSDGLDSGNSAKAAIIRLGFLEIKQFINKFTNHAVNDISVYWEPCGFADLVATCYGGMTRKVIEAYVKSGKTLRETELEHFNGYVLEGPVNVKQVYDWLEVRGGVKQYPLLCAVNDVFHRNKPCSSFMDTLKASF